MLPLPPMLPAMLPLPPNPPSASQGAALERFVLDSGYTQMLDKVRVSSGCGLPLLLC